MKQISQAFKKANQIFNPDNKEVFVQSLWDRVGLASSLTGTENFFSVQKGGSDTLITYRTAASKAKTLRDTNLPQSGADNNRDYLLFGLTMALFPLDHDPDTTATKAIRADKDYIREGGYLIFKIGDKQIMECPLIEIPELNSESAIASTASSSTIYGGPRFTSPFKNFQEPIPLRRGDVINMTVTWDGTITLQQVFDMMLLFPALTRRDS
jgi:hypothetical protein